jgi:hypothetical protein
MSEFVSPPESGPDPPESGPDPPESGPDLTLVSQIEELQHYLQDSVQRQPDIEIEQIKGSVYGGGCRINLLWIDRVKREKNDNMIIDDIANKSDFYIESVFKWAEVYSQHSSVKIVLWYDSNKETSDVISTTHRVLEKKGIDFIDIQTLFQGFPSVMPQCLQHIYNSVGACPLYLRIDLMKFIISYYDSSSNHLSVFTDFRTPILQLDDLFDAPTVACLNHLGIIFTGNRLYLEGTAMDTASSHPPERKHENSFHIIHPSLGPLLLIIIGINVYRYTLISLYRDLRIRPSVETLFNEHFQYLSDEWATWPECLDTQKLSFSVYIQLFFESLSLEVVPYIYHKVMRPFASFEYTSPCTTYPFVKQEKSIEYVSSDYFTVNLSRTSLLGILSEKLKTDILSTSSNIQYSNHEEHVITSDKQVLFTIVTPYISSYVHKSQTINITMEAYYEKMAEGWAKEFRDLKELWIPIKRMDIQASRGPKGWEAAAGGGASARKIKYSKKKRTKKPKY